MNNIKNIIFDFGGVLLDLDIERSFIELMHVLELDTNDLQLLIDKMMPYLLRYEVGDISSETFIWHVQKLSTIDVEPLELIKAWNSMLLGWNPKKLEQLAILSQKYNLFLLSNTNELHMKWVFNDLQKNHNINDFNERFFKKAYYSHLINQRKPNHSCYEYVLADAGIEAGETLFIDDTEQNTISAGQLGFQVIHHQTNAPFDFLLMI